MYPTYIEIQEYSHGKNGYGNRMDLAGKRIDIQGNGRNKRHNTDIYKNLPSLELRRNNYKVHLCTPLGDTP